MGTWSNSRSTPATGAGNVTVTRPSPGALTVTGPLPLRNGSPAGAWSFGSRSARILKTTSSGVSGRPSEKRTPLRSWNSTVRPPSRMCHCCQLAFELLGHPVHADQHTGGEEVHDLLGLFGHQQRMESLGVGTQAETQLVLAGIAAPDQRRHE